MLDLDIKKEPQFFIDFKKKKNAKSYTNDCSDKEFKNNLREHLLEEQKGQCFYCEKKIENDISKVHVDHIKQRHHYHDLECEYSNLVLSCNGKGEEHCGKYKDKQGKWDENQYLDLFTQKVNQIFKFMKNGKIVPKKNLAELIKEKAGNTITYLNLNCNDLVGARKAIFSQIPQYEQQGILKESLFEQFNEFESIFKR